MSDALRPQRLAVKLGALKPGPEVRHFDASPFIGFFHTAIQQASLDGLLLDVADYRHVPNGPYVMLVGHDVDYVIDQVGGELGLLVVRKRAEGTADELLRETLAWAIRAGAAINGFAEGGVEIGFEHVEVQLLDRRIISNDADGAETIRPLVAPAISQWVASAFELAWSSESDSRAPLTITAKIDDAPAIESLAAELPALARPEPARATEGDPQSGYDIAVEELDRMRKTGERFRLIDVREPAEFEGANLGGELIPLGQLGDKLDELPKDERYVVHCRGGGRSAKAVGQLRDAGFEDVWNVRGGIHAWSDRIDPSLPKV